MCIRDRMDSLIKQYEEEMTLRARQDAELQQEVRMRSARIIGGIAVGAVLLSVRFKVNFVPVHNQALQTRIQAATPLGSQAQEGIAQYQNMLSDNLEIQAFLDGKFSNEIFWPLWQEYLNDKIT